MDESDSVQVRSIELHDSPANGRHTRDDGLQPSKPWWCLPCYCPVILHLTACFTCMSASLSLPMLVTSTTGIKVLGTGEAFVNFNALFDAITAGLAFVCSGCVGNLSDRIGHKRIIAVQCLFVALPPLLFCAAGIDTLTGLWAFRLSQLGSQGIMAVGHQGGPAINAYLACELASGDLCAGYAWLYALIPVSSAAIIMGAGRQILSLPHGNVLLLLFSATLAAASWILAVCLPQASANNLEAERDPHVHGRCLPSLIEPFKVACSNSHLLALCVIGALITLAEGLTQSSTLQAYMVSELSIESDSAAQQFLQIQFQVLPTLLMAPISLVLPAFLKCMQKRTLLKLAIITCAISCSTPALVSWTHSNGSVIFVAVSMAFMTIPYVVLSSMIPDAATATTAVGTAMGTVCSFKQLMTLCGAALEAKTYDVLLHCGIPWATFIVFGAVALMSLFAFPWIRDPNQPDSTDQTRYRFGPTDASCRSIAKSVVYIFLNFPFAIITLVVTITLLSLGIGLLVLILGLGILIFLSYILDALIFVDVSFAAWVLHPAPHVSRPPRIVGTGGCMQRFQSYICSGYKGSSIIYFALMKLPINVAAWVLLVILWSVSMGLISVPIQFICGIPLCWGYESGGPRAISTAWNKHCKGLAIDSLWKSLGPCFFGLVLAPLCGQISVQVARASARCTVWWHGATTITENNSPDGLLSRVDI